MPFTFEHASGFIFKPQNLNTRGNQNSQKSYATLDRRGLESLSWLMFSETLEKFVSVCINVNTTSTLPKLSMSEGLVFTGSPNYIKGRLTVIPPYFWVLSLSWVSLSSLCQSGPSRVSRVCECSLLLFWSMPGPHPCLESWSMCSDPYFRCNKDPTRALGYLLTSMWLYVRGLNANTL